jgi:hypothetical protein
MSVGYDLDTRVRLHVYHYLLATARAPLPVQTAAALQVSGTEVEAALRRLEEAHLLVLKPGTAEIWMAKPLSAVPTAFTVEAESRSWYANCIWDSLGIVAMVGFDATVHTTCPDCDTPISLRIESQQLAGDDEVIHFAVPACHWWDDIGYT